LEERTVGRKLSAIFAADVEGYSRLMGLEEVGTLRTLTAYRVFIDRLIASHRGRIFNTAGDSLVADFASAVDAVQLLSRCRTPWPRRTQIDLPVSRCGSASTSTSAISSFRAIICLATP